MMILFVSVLDLLLIRISEEENILIDNYRNNPTADLVYHMVYITIFFQMMNKSH